MEAPTTYQGRPVIIVYSRDGETVLGYRRGDLPDGHTAALVATMREAAYPPHGEDEPDPLPYQLAARAERADPYMTSGIDAAPTPGQRLRAMRQDIGRRLTFASTYGDPPRWLDQLMDRPDPLAGPMVAVGGEYTATQSERLSGIGARDGASYGGRLMVNSVGAAWAYALAAGDILRRGLNGER